MQSYKTNYFAVVVLFVALILSLAGTVGSILSILRNRSYVDEILLALAIISTAVFALTALVEKSFLASGSLYLVFPNANNMNLCF